MTKLESVTLIRRALKREKFYEIEESKTIRKIYEKCCQTSSVEERYRISRPKKIKSKSFKSNQF